MPEITRSPDAERTYQLMRVALGEAEADLAIAGGSVVNVYSGEVLPGQTVLVKGDKIAYVGGNPGKAIGAGTQVIDAAGKTVIPGFIDGHSHCDYPYSPWELARYALKGATTTVVTEIAELAFPLGYAGLMEYMRSLRVGAMKIYSAIPPMTTISPLSRQHLLSTGEMRRLLRQKDAITLGETYWGPAIQGDENLLGYIAVAKEVGKKMDGHTAGARGAKLQAYASLGITSDHEPTTAEETLERLRLGLFVLLREGEIRRELEEIIPKIKDEKVDFRRLIVATDGLGPWQLTTDGYLDFLVQKVINLGMDPVTAIQMGTLNVAQRFALDDRIGGIAPGRFADIVVIPDLRTIKAEYVISNGKVAVKGGEILAQPRKFAYSSALCNSMRLGKRFTADDFAVAGNGGKARVRVADQITRLVTREAIVELPVRNGRVQVDPAQDTIKVAAVERAFAPGKTAVGFIRGLGMKRGAMATSITWDTTDVVVVGADEADMALCMNRIADMQGGIVVCAGGKVLAELALPVAGFISTEPMEYLSQQLRRIQDEAEGVGCIHDDMRLTLAVMTTGAIPFLRICEEGLFDVRLNKFVPLMAD